MNARRKWSKVRILCGAFAGLSLMGGLNGCGDSAKQEPSKGTSGSKVEVISAQADPNKNFRQESFKDWPKPTVAFAITGEMHGYIEPCGCSEPQYGGIARRASLLKQLREQEWPVASFDLGGTLKNARQQSQFKFQALLASLRDMQYSSLQIGVEELRLGAGWLVSQDVIPEEGKASEGLRLLAANIVLFGSAELPTPVCHQLVKAGNLRIGVTGVFGNSLKEKLGNVDPNEISFTDPATAIESALTAIDAQKPDLRVLICHGTLSEARKLAEKFPTFNLIVATTDIEEPLTDNPQQIGEALLITTGHKGKYVAVVGYYPQEEKRKFRFDLVKLDGDRFKNDSKMIEHMQFYQDMLKDADLLSLEPAIKHASGHKFVGAEKCGECHTKALAKWNESKHSHAFESLKTGRLGISRIYDPECICCHTVGWNAGDVLRYESGYVTEAKSAHLKGVQCESCHGPGSQHIELIEQDKKEEANKSVRVTLAESRKRFLCESCHDHDNSPHFDFEKYWPQIAHPGKD